MDEVKETIQPQTEVKTNEVNNENLSMLERIENSKKEIEQIEKRVNEKKIEMENLIAKNMLGGRSFAGTPIKTADEIKKEKIKEETDQMIKQFFR